MANGQAEPDLSGQIETESQVQESRYHGQLMRFLDSLKKAVIVMGSCLLLFAAARNSFHWHIHRIWGATGSFWQSCWDHVYHEWFQENDFMMTMLGSFVVTTVVFWVANAFFLILDMWGLPSWAQRCKIQEDKKIETVQLMNAVKQAVFNQTVAGIPSLAALAYVTQLLGCPVGGELPTFQWVLLEILVFSLVIEVFFYYSHRLLHHPKLYKCIHKTHHEWTAPIGIVSIYAHTIEYAVSNILPLVMGLLHHPKLYKCIHKTHHEWTAPIGIVSIYAHPIEYVVSNILPLVLGPVFMRSHLATSWLWFCLGILSTVIAHCGYHLPLLPSSEAHDYHHHKLDQNFGVWGVLDRLHGTDTRFLASPQYQRHLTLLSLTPLTQQYPDSQKTKPE